MLSDCAPGQQLDSAEAMSVILSCEQNNGKQNVGSTPNKHLLTFQHVFVKLLLTILPLCRTKVFKTPLIRKGKIITIVFCILNQLYLFCCSLRIISC